MGLKDWWYKLKASPVADVIKRKHRFVVMDTDTFKEKLSFQLSGINLFVVIGITIIVLILVTTVLIAFTPMREWIPGYTDTKTVEQTYSNAKKLDSLQVQLENQEWMIATLQAILKGEVPREQAGHSPDSNTSLQQQAIVYRRSVEDSLLRLEVEQEDNRYQVKAAAEAMNAVNTEQQPTMARLFFTPLKGNIVTPYGADNRGVNISGDANSAVCASYSGTVVFAGFTSEEGQVIAIQHPGNVVSVYSNCSSLLKHRGDAVRTGEPIGYVGSGSNPNLGVYLHFELWINGTSVNPEEYLSF